MGVDFKTAEKEIESILREFVQDWMGAASLALEAANKPKPETRSYWILALAGNLAWAIGGFFPVTNALKLVILGAAVLGADTTTKVAEQVRGDPPTPEKLLAGRIAETADALEIYILNQSFKWEWAKKIQAYDLADAQDYDAAREFVWEKMVFINIKYRKRRKQLLDKMVSTIESQVSSFNTQWQQWKSDTKKYKPAWACMDKEIERYPYGMIDYKRIRDRCFADYPPANFQPYLYFPLQVVDDPVRTQDGRPISQQLRGSGSFPVPN